MPRYGTGGVTCSSGCSGGPRIVEYVATGAELPAGFIVQIGATLADANYNVSFFGVDSDIFTPPSWSFPWGGYTTSQFQARFVDVGIPLTAGGLYKFQIVE
jgi:hypothetical protein